MCQILAKCLKKYNKSNYQKCDILTNFNFHEKSLKIDREIWEYLKSQTYICEAIEE